MGPCRPRLNRADLAHNPEVAGSNPAPATKKYQVRGQFSRIRELAFLLNVGRTCRKSANHGIDWCGSRSRQAELVAGKPSQRLRPSRLTLGEAGVSTGSPRSGASGAQGCDVALLLQEGRQRTSRSRYRWNTRAANPSRSLAVSAPSRSRPGSTQSPPPTLLPDDLRTALGKIHGHPAAHKIVTSQVQTARVA